MSKRNQIIKESAESLALKRLREASGQGIRRVAELMDLSHTRVHQMESGREDITEEYIEKFLDTVQVSRGDWNKEIGIRECNGDLREKCFDLVCSIKKEKLKTLHNILLSLNE